MLLFIHSRVVNPLSFLWCCRSSAGSNRWPEKVVLVSSLDEDDDNDVFSMDTSAVPDESFRWVLIEFSKMALSRHFGQARDSLTPFFSTKGQYMLYRGGIDIRPMYMEHQWLSWPHLESFMYKFNIVFSRPSNRQAPHYYKPYFGYLSSCIMSYALHVVLDSGLIYITPRVTS